MRVLITVSQKGARFDTIDKLVKDALSKKFPDADISVQRKETPESRSERWAEAQSLVADAKAEAEDLRDEMQNWYGSLPENLQNGSKADEIQTAIDALEDIISSLENAETEVDFPAMY